MNHRMAIVGLIGAAVIVSVGTVAQQRAARTGTPLEFFRAEGSYKTPSPITPAVKAGKLVFVSGTPAFDKSGAIAVGDFPAQMKQVMENITATLHAAGAGWDRVAKVNVYLTRREDFAEMNRIYASYFPSGNYPARTTAVVYSLPQASYLLEIECVAVLE
jgi:2-iminobutanoate/2-iminopropanoate deaminase